MIADPMENDEYMTVPVPSSANMAWWRIAAMSSIFSLSLPTFISGLELAHASTSRNFMLGSLAGGALLAVIAGSMGAVGSLTRQSSYMLTRIAFGSRGSVLVNVSFALSLIGWFGVNINLFSDAIDRLLGAYAIYEGPAWPIELIGGSLMTATTVIGLRAIDRLSLVLAPLLLVVCALMLLSILHIGSLQAVLSRSPTTGLSLGDVISAVVGVLVVGAVTAPDLTRFLQHWCGAIAAAGVTYVASNTLVTTIGGLAGLATGRADMLTLMIAIGLGWGAFVTVIGGSWIVNALNLYSSVLSIATSAPKARRGLVTLCCGAGGTFAAFFNILDHFVTFLFYLSIIFVPVAGIVVIDILCLRRSAYFADRAAGTLPRYQWSAIASWVLGAGVAIAASEGLVTLTRVAALDAILAGAMARLAIGRVFKTHEQTSAAA